LPDLALSERVGRIVALAVVGLDPDAAAEGARPRARLPAHDLDVGVPHDAHDPAEEVAGRAIGREAADDPLERVLEEVLRAVHGEPAREARRERAEPRLGLQRLDEDA